MYVQVKNENYGYVYIPKISGIYSMTNIINHKSYWGSSKNIKNRWNQHRGSLRQNKHENPHLQNAWNKYGENNFEFKIEEEFPENELKYIEQQYLNWVFMLPKYWFYNIGRDANVWNRGMTGLPKHTEEHKKKISMSLVGIKRSKETRNKMSISLVGNKNHLNHKHTEKTLNKMLRDRKENKKYIKDYNIYVFKNRVTGEIFKGLRKQFYIKYNFHKDRCNVSHLIKGEIKSHKDWIFISKEENNLVCL